MIPSKPVSAPTNVAASTTSSAIYIKYDAVTEDGGSAILNYNIYIDDGNAGAFGSAINNGLSLTYDTSSLTLTAGLTYRFKYSAVNSQGEGPLSDGVAILLAQTPSAPQTLTRVEVTTLAAGNIKVTWQAPASDGGSTISGYNVYLSGKLLYQAKNTEYNYTFYGLTVGTSYSVGVSAVNVVGESTQSTLTVLAASVPSKQSWPYWKSSTTESIEVQWSVPSYDGGSPVIGYQVRRDDGAGTSFLANVTTTDLFYNFTGLSNTVLTYRVQVAAENILGVGEYSDPYQFYAASVPSAPTSFTVVSQSTSMISLSWSKPTTLGG